MIFSESLLVRRARNGDKHAFQQLMERQMVSMYKVAKAILRNDEDVADAMQETALTCWEKMEELKQDKYFRSWMIRILINYCNAIYRRRQTVVSEETVPEIGALEPGYEHTEWDLLLHTLDEKYRVVILLFYAEGFKTKEIAEILHISEGTVRVRLSRGRELLRRQLEADSTEPSFDPAGYHSVRERRI